MVEWSKRDETTSKNACVHFFTIYLQDTFLRTEISMVEHDHHRVPVTALAFIAGRDIILAGEGSILKVYDAESGGQLSTLTLFEGQAIHGIVVSSDNDAAFVWGGPLFTKISIRFLEDGGVCLSKDPVAKASDWILDAAFNVHIDTGYELAMVTAHNTLLFPSIDEGSISSDLTALVEGDSNCILYAAHVCWLSASHLLIASGTAFGDVILWSCHIHQNDAGHSVRSSKTHYTFLAHEGSVFGVQISSKLQLSLEGGSSYLLATCSDDRSIKVWDISDFDAQVPASAQQHRDTGFGHSLALEETAPTCLAKAMGHVSRIWHVRFLVGKDILDDRPNDAPCVRRISIMSFGEDATCIAWELRLTPDGSMPFMLAQQYIIEAHSGKHIWSVGSDSAGRTMTGGADGAIAVHSRTSPCRSVAEIQCCRSSPSDRYRAYAFVGESLVATTDQGRILLITLASVHQEELIHEISPGLPYLKGYSIVTSIDQTAIIAGMHGTLYIYKQNTKSLIHLTRGTGKVAGLFACSTESGSNFLLVTSVTSHTASLYSWLEKGDGELNTDELTKSEICLEIPKDFVVTSFCMIQERAQRTIAVLGSRGGGLAVFDWTHHLYSPTSLLVNHVHGVEAVTAILCEVVYEQDRRSIYLHSTGRDGTQATQNLRYVDGSLTLDLIHQLSLPFGPNIEGLAMVNNDLLVWGFKGRHFVVHDTVRQHQVMTVDCGGSHRQWAYRAQLEGGSFVWTKASKVYRVLQAEPAYKVLNTGGHGREIKAVAVHLGIESVIATGSEDTDIKLFPLADTGFECQRTLRRHITGIQVMQWSDDGSYLFSSGGYEEFFVWRIHQGGGASRLGVVCESSHPNNGASDLRIMDFDVKSSIAGHTITMVYSNSAVKQWLYSRSAGWVLLASGDYMTACLTHVRHLSSPKMLLSTATDGHLSIWSEFPSGSLTWSRRQRIHQSSILSLATHDLPNKSTLVITGGDDNAIGLTIVASTEVIRSSAQVPVLGTLLVPRAHAAAITGIALRVLSSTKLMLISSSIDQRVKTWLVDLIPECPGVEGIAVAKVKDVGTDVADVSDLAILGDKVLVVGVGMDLQRLPSWTSS